MRECVPHFRVDCLEFKGHLRQIPSLTLPLHSQVTRERGGGRGGREGRRGGREGGGGKNWVLTMHWNWAISTVYIVHITYCFHSMLYIQDTDCMLPVNFC